MKDLSCFFRISAFAFIASLSFSLVACDDSSSASDDDVPGSSGDVPELSSGAEPESSSSDESDLFGDDVEFSSEYCDSIKTSLVPDLKCDESLEVDGWYYKYEYYAEGYSRGCPTLYFKCEKGEWAYVSEENISGPNPVTSDRSIAEYGVYPLNRKKCTAENEGLVDSSLVDGEMTYDKCINGRWKTGVYACDTAGVTEGAICRKTVKAGMWKYPYDEIVTYIYDGNGIWYEYEIPHLEVYCGDDDGKKGLKTYGNETGSYTEYYTCLNGELLRLSELEYYCSEESDTCSYELNGKTQYSLRKDSSWVKCDYDSTVGYCCTDDDFYREAGEKYYYCGKGTWLQPELIPHQYTDSRKDSLTDAEFDVLDLPKDASVGDVAGGLMEDCYHAPLFPKDGVYWDVDDEVSEYCISRKYYTYGADGTWGVYSIPNEYRACTSEIEGEEFWNRRSTPDYNFYDINKCESSEWKHVGYNFSRSKKK